MDPDRKRKIRLVVALSAAVLLAAALVYTSFSASSEARSRPTSQGVSGGNYELTGKVSPGSVDHDGSELNFDVADRDDPERKHPGRLHGRGPRPVPRRPRGDRHRHGQGRHLRRRARQPDHQVPVEVRRRGGPGPRARRDPVGSMVELGAACLIAAPVRVRVRGGRRAHRRAARRPPPGRLLAARDLRALRAADGLRGRARGGVPALGLLGRAGRRPLLDDDPARLQADRDVVEPGRLAAALGLGALDRLQRRALS